jgi:hypothetical protein
LAIWTKLEDEGSSPASTLIAELEANALSFGAEGTGDKWGNERLSIALAVEVDDKGLIIARGIEQHNTQDLQQVGAIKPVPLRIGRRTDLFRQTLQDNERSMMVNSSVAAKHEANQALSDDCHTVVLWLPFCERSGPLQLEVNGNIER